MKNLRLDIVIMRKSFDKINFEIKKISKKKKKTKVTSFDLNDL